MSRVLLVEDHERLAGLIQKGLAADGIAVDTVSRMDSAWTALTQLSYQALVLDRGLPDGDGIALLYQLRRANMGIPCLVLTARDALHDRIQGLDAGADDYLPKPFAMEEMVARVRALLRRPVVFQSANPSYGDVLLQEDTSELRCGDLATVLAPAELQIMLLLVRKQGQVVRRSALESAAWGLGEAVTPNALDVALHRLRRKLSILGSGQQIVNMRGLGYALAHKEVAQ